MLVSTNRNVFPDKKCNSFYNLRGVSFELGLSSSGWILDKNFVYILTTIVGAPFTLVSPI